MTLDVSTLNLAGGCVTCASGLFLFANWWQDRRAKASLWWAVANCGTGIGATLLALHESVPVFAFSVGAPFLLNACAALAWVAARLFNRGSVKPHPVVMLVGTWLVLVAIAGACGYERAAILLGAGVSGCLYAAAALEFWLARSEKLGGRLTMIGVLTLQAFALVLVALGFFSGAMLKGPAASVSWFGIIYFVELVYAVGSAVTLVTMLKARTEAGHKTTALIDPLTGLANRRAIMDRAQRMFETRELDDEPIAVLAFDLDGFKVINDTFGHATGDQALRIFADVLTKGLSSTAVAGRIGGEEFLALLPGCGTQAALSVAGRIRATFQSEACFVSGQRVGATVSVGVASSTGNVSPADLIASADRALYRAKNLGRNRVVPMDGLYREPNDNVVRIA